MNDLNKNIVNKANFFDTVTFIGKLCCGTLLPETLQQSFSFYSQGVDLKSLLPQLEDVTCQSAFYHC